MEITNEKEVLKKIINIINLLHPVQTPRIDLDMSSFKRPSTDIIINLIEEDNVPHTFISILDGTENFKQSVPNGNILTDTILDINTLKEIIDYLLANFPVVYNFNVNSNSISFTLSFSKNNDFYITPGISLENISLEIRITDLKLQKKLKEYLIFILSTYYVELKQTPYWQETIEKNKKKILFEMEYEYIIDFVSHLSEEEIRKLLVNITNERFIEIMNDMISKETKLERLKPQIC